MYNESIYKEVRIEYELALELQCDEEDEDGDSKLPAILLLQSPPMVVLPPSLSLSRVMYDFARLRINEIWRLWFN